MFHIDSALKLYTDLVNAFFILNGSQNDLEKAAADFKSVIFHRYENVNDVFG